MKTITEADKDFVCEIQAPCFQQLSREEVDQIRNSKTQVLFRKGDTLTKQGTFASYILFLISGVVKLYIEGNDNRNFNISIILPGEFIGLSSVFSKNKYTYTTSGLTDCQALLIEKESLERILRENGTFSFNLTQRYCVQNATLHEVLYNQQFKQMNGRLAGTLLYLNRLKENQPNIFQLLTRKDLANFAGISTESTVKLLKTFEKDGLIELQEKDILLLDIDNMIGIYKRG
ncbi:MAG: Crp/Fnr family transcriptional regulator [Bacteroidales bacterium]|nr:Crp/Fnr family transcriptional regulator [Bacteroidales bacterium]MDD4712132.1 Crp/Fnr family transcriptional regulator [Bacteroidales bacterium]